MTTSNNIRTMKFYTGSIDYWYFHYKLYYKKIVGNTDKVLTVQQFREKNRNSFVSIGCHVYTEYFDNYLKAQ